MSALREIFASLGIEVDSEELENAGKKVDGFMGKLKLVGETVAEAFAFDKVKEFVESQVEAATELERTALMLGVTTEELEKLRYAAGDAGVSTQALDAGLRFLNRNIGEAIAKGGEAAEVFKKLKIEVKNADGTTRDASAVMADLADAIEKIPDGAERARVASELLGRHMGAQLIPLLSKGKAAFEEADKAMRELGGPTSKEFLDSAKAIEEAQHRMDVGWGNIKQAIAIQLFPIFNTLVDWFTKASKVILAATKDTNTLAYAVIFLGGIAMAKAISSVFALARAFGILKAESLGAAVGEALAAWPIVLMGAAILSVFLLFEDFFTLLTGGKSIIGDLIDSFAGIGASKQFVYELQLAWEDVIDAMQTLGRWVGDLASIFVDVLIMPTIHGLEGIAKALLAIGTGHPIDAMNALREAGEKTVAQLNEAKHAWDDMGKAATAPIHGAVHEEEATYGQYGPKYGKGSVGVGAITYGAAAVKAAGRVREPVGVSVQRAGAGGGVHIHQTSTTHVTVTAKKDEAKAIGDAVGQGVATSHERAMSNAVTALTKQ